MSKRHCDWVNTYLQEKGWDFSRVNDSMFKCGVKLDRDNEDAWISGTYVLNDDCCIFIASPRFEVPESRYTEVGLLFTLLNKILCTSTLVLDVNCGWIGCRIEMFFDEDKPIPVKVFEKMILSNCEVMRYTATTIRKVSIGELSAKQAIKELDMAV